MHLLVVFVHFAGVIHRAELWAAHGTEGCGFVSLFGEGFIVHGAGGLGIEGKFELLFPIELVAGIAWGVVAVAGSGTLAGYVSGVGGDLVGDDSVFHIFFVGQAEMFFGSY